MQGEWPSVTAAACDFFTKKRDSQTAYALRQAAAIAGLRSCGKGAKKRRRIVLLTA
jgi:hypothetical protein